MWRRFNWLEEAFAGGSSWRRMVGVTRCFAARRRARAVYNLAGMLMYMAVYTRLRAHTHGCDSRRENRRNSPSVRDLTAVEARTGEGSRNLGIRARNLGFWRRNLGISGLNLGFQIVTSALDSMLTRTYVNARGYDPTFLHLPRMRARAHARRNRNAVHEVAGN